MLEITRVSQPEDKRKLFAEFNPQQGSWIVSDLQSKWHLQRVLLEKHGVLEDHTVMRATDLWKHLAFQLIPGSRVLSRELAQTLFWNWLQPLNLPWARSPQAVPVLLNQMQMWMSVFAAPNSDEIMAQWFKENPESYVRWGHWFELCARIWNKCQEEDLVMASWLPAVILSRDVGGLQWNRSLTFDLGPRVSQVEGLLLKELARVQDVNVIYPEAPWVGLMKNAMKPYTELLPKPYTGDVNWQPSVDGSLEFARFSTQLAEVKDSVGRVREWLENGVAADKIAIVAPDIEHYWPVLQLYLLQEGIPANKATTSRLGSYSEMAQWVATLRTALSKVSADDLEIYFFAESEQPRLGFDEFRILFSHVYDSLDLQRARHLFESKIAPAGKDPQTLQEFFVWAMKFWSVSSSTLRLTSLLQVAGAEVPREMKLLPVQWLSYLEGLLARRELNLRGADERGVWCVSLSSADWLDVTHGIFLNLSEGALRSTDISPVSAGEAQKIFTDTGFALASSDHQELEFELLWFLKRSWKHLQLNFSATDFQGGVQTPSRMWMWAGIANQKLKHAPQAPRLTRWDEIQRQSLEKLAALRGMNESQRIGLENGLSRDAIGLPSTWREKREVRISASSLKSYWECPFVFAASRKLKLSDDPVLDLDLDHRTRGNLLHGVAEELLSEPLLFERSDEELREVIVKAREKAEIRMGDERLWPAVSAQHVRLGRQFLELEKIWRERFPTMKTVGREIGFECSWDLEAAMPVAAKGPVTIAGRLDRVDMDSRGRYAVIDYKARAGESTRNWKSWLENGDVQLALYAQLLELGLLELEKGAVTAANYYIIRNSERHKGYHLKEEDAELYNGNDKHRNFITLEEKQELFAETRRKIHQAVLDIINGKLNPQPKNEKICASCAWRSLCRAPHLN